jgi:hypothetical protein
LLAVVIWYLHDEIRFPYSVPDDDFENHTCSPLSSYVLNDLEDLQERRFMASKQSEFTANKYQQQKKENPEFI